MKPSAAPKPSFVTLRPTKEPNATILDFMDRKFPFVGRDVWRKRLERGKITDDRGNVITLDTPYRAGLRLRYFREVEEEAAIPFAEEVILQDARILVADKPHFLPVIPSGPYVNECLLYRLRKLTGNENLVPIHRIDRETAGLVMFSVDPATRHLYGGLLKRGKVRKLYEAIASMPKETDRREWTVESRIVAGVEWFRSQNAEGTPNAKTIIRLCETRGALGRFELEPVTGKRHQLRLHMTQIGCQIVNDPYYPELQPEPKTGFDAPLQLLARELEFIDPVDGTARRFRSSRRLEW